MAGVGAALGETPVGGVAGAGVALDEAPGFRETLQPRPPDRQQLGLAR